MFHSDAERNRNVEPHDESHQPYAPAATTTTTADKRDTTGAFELGQFEFDDFATFGFDLDCDLGGRGDSTSTAAPRSQQSSAFSFGQPQCFSTFTPEDQWPI